jgi:FKBP-type peptidyl-prolyl cis-trans isomerase
MGEVVKAYQQLRMANEPVNKAGLAFLAANKDKPGITTLPNGLQYKVLKSGTGKTPKVGEKVVVNYRGTLIDGREFDSSYQRQQPFEFTLGGQVITGWNEIIQKMKVGDKWEVYIPTELAYGATPRQGGIIRPNDPLIFEIELLQVK